MSSKNRYDLGFWNVICDQCGRQFKSDELRLRWDGFMVCSEDWEPRQPQDFVHGVADIQAPPYTRPESSDVFVFLCTPISTQGIADYGQAGCARSDVDDGYRPACTFEGSSCIALFAVSGCAVSGKPFPGDSGTVYPSGPFIPDVITTYSAIPSYAIPGYATPGVTYT